MLLMSFIFPYPKGVDKSKYLEISNRLEARYGLPPEVKFCKSCVISNQRPSTSVEHKNDGFQKKNTINFNENNICDACLVKKEKETIDWAERESLFRDICNKYRKNDGSYDCLVPGSGGKDSFMTAHLLKYKYGMHPLTCTWAPHIYTDWGWENLQAWIDAGFDNILFTPNRKVHRFITRLATEKLLYPFQPFILGQKNYPPKVAIQNNIELIIYGENQAEYGNKKEDSKDPKMSNAYFSVNQKDNIFIGGFSTNDLINFGLSKVDIDPYLPLDREIIEKNKINYQYLGFYEKWHPQGAYYYSMQNGNFRGAPERSAGTYNTYNSIDDKVDDFHYHSTFIKFGIGRATYDTAQEIRSGEITREEGVALIKKYDGEFPKRWSEEIFRYLSISSEEFGSLSDLFENPIFDRKYYDLICDNHRSPHLWKWSASKGWELRKNIDDEDFISQELTAKNWKGNQ